MEIAELEIFRAVAEERSVTRAARRLRRFLIRRAGFGTSAYKAFYEEMRRAAA